MTVTEIIAALGGARAVAERFGLARSSVYDWQRNGIPARFWLAVLDIAEAEHIAGITRAAVEGRPAKEAVK
jgi:hypothetical protein